MIKPNISMPNIVHSEKGNGFHNMFKDQCKKIEYSLNRVEIVSTPFFVTNAYVRNYDDINWIEGGKKMRKMLC